MRALRPLLAILALALPLAAQTPGNAGVNDFWITPGGTPGGASCKPLTLTTPLTMVSNINAAPAAPYAVILGVCPCLPCANNFPMPSSPCVAPIVTGCGSNQFLEVASGGVCPIIVLFSGVTSNSGSAVNSVNVPLVTNPLRFSFQTVFLAPPTCVVPPFNVMMSQAWNVLFI